MIGGRTFGVYIPSGRSLVPPSPKGVRGLFPLFYLIGKIFIESPHPLLQGGAANQARRVLLLFVFVATLWPLTACDTTRYARLDIPKAQMDAYLQDKPENLHPVYRDVLEEGDRNFVLNHMKGGLAALELGADPIAADSFDSALLSIESVYTENENAEKARSVWYEEGRKDFKGEPYERAMAYYYRGLLYLKKGDYENARASFKGGQLQDALAEDQKYQMDFALLIFLEGWASLLSDDEDMAQEAFDEVKSLRPEFIPPTAGHNVLVIAESGHAPEKVATGQGGSELRFKRGIGFRERSARFNVGGHDWGPYLSEDIFWQARTRGGRVVDKILKGKVHFKETTQAVGETLTTLGVYGMVASHEAGSDAGMVASGIITAIGLVGQGVAASTQTRADNRFWTNLPDAVHVFTYYLDSDAPQQDVHVDFVDKNGEILSGLTREEPVLKTDGGFGLVWVRSRSATQKF